MAKIYQHERQLEKDIQHLKIRRFIHQLVCVVGVLLVIIIHWQWQQVVLTLVALTLVGLSMVRLSSLSNQLGKVTAGLVGEDKALQILKGLPSEFSIFPDVHIKVGGQESQLDTIVVGPTGIFVVEVKNYTGIIVGDGGEKNLLQIKQGTYEKTFYNPVKQVATHTYRLHQYLLENDLSNWVQGTVYFANELAKVDIHNDTKTPIFSAKENGSKRLLYYIEEMQGQSVSKREQKRIEKLLHSNLK